jgi:hypothetical protein
LSQFLFAVIDFPAKTLSKSGKMVGDELGDWAIWSVAEQSSKQIGIEHFGAHDLRRTCAKLCRKNGGDLEQIKFLLGPLLNTDDRTLFRLRAGDRRCCERQFGTMTWGAAKSCYRSRAGGGNDSGRPRPYRGHLIERKFMYVCRKSTLCFLLFRRTLATASGSSKGGHSLRLYC